MNPLKALALIALTAFAFLLGPIRQADQSKPNVNRSWVPDRGDGTYRNPIIYADYSDPDVIRVADDFYMIASSFNCVPGLPILHSRDLVNWKIVAHVFQQQVPQDVFSKPQHGNGVWAPAIRHHQGTFYVFYPDPDFGIYLVKARNPAGPWSDPLLIKSARGWIDPCPFWDKDGNAYLVHAWANSRAGIKSILTINRLSPDGSRVLDEGKTVFDGRSRHPTIEGPKLYKRNGYYYIFAPAGGVPTGWQTVLRSRNIYGPYEDKIVMDQGRTGINGPHQGGWVELKSGESWFIHFQDQGAFGRVIHLQPLKWVDDWPVIGSDADGDGKGEPVLAYKKPDVGKNYPTVIPQSTDEFNGKRLGLQWQWHANYDVQWMSLTARPGWLRLRSVEPDNAANLWSVPNLLLQKLPAPEFTVTTRIDFSKLALGEKAGLLMMGTDYSYLAVERTSSGLRLSKVVCMNADKGTSELVEGEEVVTGSSLILRVAMSGEAACEFAYSSDGREFRSIGQRFTARPGKWIGAKVGLFCLGKRGQQPRFADFGWFRFE
ncbi:MAG: glycoside hydrolase family 43 protein [Pyrinomonadaceae bacterium]